MFTRSGQHQMRRRSFSFLLALGLIMAGVIGSIYVLFFSAAIHLTIAGASEIGLGFGLTLLYFDFDAVPSDQEH